MGVVAPGEKKYLGSGSCIYIISVMLKCIKINGLKNTYVGYVHTAALIIALFCRMDVKITLFML